MKRTLRSTATALALGLAATASQAIVLGFQPAAQTRFVGQAVSVDLVASGLDADAQVVWAYDIDVTFDDSILDLLSVTFTDNLGGFGFAFGGFLQGVGVVNLVEASVADAADLDLLQGDSVVLATLVFQGQTPGTSALGFGQTVSLRGYQLPEGDPAEPIQPNRLDGSITIVRRDDGGNVPEPGSLALAALALVGMGGLRKGRN